MNEKLS